MEVISFSDVETADTHTASFVPQGSGYVGTFSLDPVSEAGGTGSVAWHYSVDNADIQFLAQGQTLSQTYTVTIMDDHGQLTQQDVTVAINGANDGPTAVDETIISDAGADGAIQVFRPGRWPSTTPIPTRSIICSSTASSPARAVTLFRSATSSLSTMRRRVVRSPTPPPTASRPAATLPPRP